MIYLQETGVVSIMSSLWHHQWVQCHQRFQPVLNNSHMHVLMTETLVFIGIGRTLDNSDIYVRYCPFWSISQCWCVCSFHHCISVFIVFQVSINART